MPNWAGSWICFAIVAVVALAISHFVVKRWVRKEEVRRPVEYGLLLLGGLSIISGTFQSNATIAQWKYKIIKPQVDAAHSNVDFWLTDSSRALCETTFVKDEYSPSNFDDVVAEQQRACGYSKDLIRRKAEWFSPADQAIVLPPPGGRAFGDFWVRGVIAQLTNAVKQYNQVAVNAAQLRQQSETSVPEIALALYGPYVALVSLALALALIAYPAVPEVSGGSGLGERAVAKKPATKRPEPKD